MNKLTKDILAGVGLLLIFHILIVTLNLYFHSQEILENIGPKIISDFIIYFLSIYLFSKSCIYFYNRNKN